MKNLLLTFCFAVWSVCYSVAQTTGLNPRLARVIDSLYLADQRTVTIKPADSAAAAYQRTIHTNFPTVEKILNTYGYPTYTLVGQESGKHYFLLVQHSDFNPKFQQRVLKLMRPAVRQREASGQQYAYLIDRTAVNQGKPQVYGTQILMSGNTQIKSCIAPAKLNSRRKAMGLEPIEDYLKKCNEAFYRMNPQESVKPTGR